MSAWGSPREGELAATLKITATKESYAAAETALGTGGP
jgi:hypothetical protein